MEAELTSLDSQLERAKMTHAARCSRLEEGKTDKTETSPDNKTLEVKRALFPHESDMDGRRHPTLDPDLHGNRMDHWTPQLDFSYDKAKVNTGSSVLLCWVLPIYAGSRSTTAPSACADPDAQRMLSFSCRVSCVFAGKRQATDHLRSMFGQMHERKHVR